MLIDRADCSDQAGIEKGLNARAEFQGRLLRHAGHVRFEDPATGIDRRTAFRFERRERRSNALVGVGNNVVDLIFDAAVEILDGVVRSFLQERASFRGARFEFQRDFARYGLFLLHEPDEIPVGDTGSDGFEFLCCVPDGLFDSGEILRLEIAWGAFDDAASLCELAAGFTGEPFQLLRELSARLRACPRSCS